MSILSIAYPDTVMGCRRKLLVAAAAFGPHWGLKHALGAEARSAVVPRPVTPQQGGIASYTWWKLGIIQPYYSYQAVCGDSVSTKRPTPARKHIGMKPIHA